ncbi:MAG: Fpg/Nei family DNA glycosylase [Candidatus Azotimanducaceae bacterium WSBS_2022_MAG_OTU7]
MPELPDLSNYIESLKPRVIGEPINGIRISSPFILRSVEPSAADITGKTVTGLSLIGKRVIFELEDRLYIAIHLMIAGRFRWYKPGAKIPGKLGLMAFDLPNGTLMLTEAGQKHRASVFFVRGKEVLEAFNAGGANVFDIDLTTFIECLTRKNHTIKRSITDQKFLAGIGNAYSDEILHHARISPMRQTRTFTDDEWQRLFNSTRLVLNKWITKLREETGDKFPTKVTAFHPEMAVHGKFKQPCPDCGKPVQRIRYANRECNYCAKCQNQGNLLADRSLSRLLKKDWPKTLEELESVAEQG